MRKCRYYEQLKAVNSNEEYNAAVQNQIMYQASLNAITAALDNIRDAAKGPFSVASSGSSGGSTTQPNTGGTNDNGGDNTPQNPSKLEGETGGGTDGGATTPITAPTTVAEEEETIIDLAVGVDQADAEGRGLVAAAGNNVGAAIGDLQGDGTADEEYGDDELEPIPEEEVPLADVDLEDVNGGALESDNELVAIDEEEVPLADIEAERSKMSWWWLLIVLLLGVTGEEMCRRHKKKMEEENAVK